MVKPQSKWPSCMPMSRTQRESALHYSMCWPAHHFNQNTDIPLHVGKTAVCWWWCWFPVTSYHTLWALVWKSVWTATSKLLAHVICASQIKTSDANRCTEAKSRGARARPALDLKVMWNRVQRGEEFAFKPNIDKNSMVWKKEGKEEVRWRKTERKRKKREIQGMASFSIISF